MFTVLFFSSKFRLRYPLKVFNNHWSPIESGTWCSFKCDDQYTDGISGVRIYLMLQEEIGRT